MNKLVTPFLLFVFAIGLSIPSVQAQEIEINPFASYFLAGRLNGYYADAKFDNGPAFGGALSYGLGRGKHIEVSYTYAKSGAYLEDNTSGAIHDNTDMTFGYIQAGYVQELIPRNMPELRPYVMIAVGAAYLKPDDPTFLTEWKFAGSIGGGFKYFITDKIGFRIHARLLMPLFFEEIGGSCGTYGCGAGIDAITSLAQGDFGGGLIIRLRGDSIK